MTKHGEVHKLRTTCPGCGTLLPLQTPFMDDGETRGPEAGDIQICITCGSINVFNDELKLEVSGEDWETKFEPEVVAQVKRAVEYIKKENKRKQDQN